MKFPLRAWTLIRKYVGFVHPVATLFKEYIKFTKLVYNTRYDWYRSYCLLNAWRMPYQISPYSCINKTSSQYNIPH